ncbi:PAS domain S-box protein [Methanoculleus caldifontis]|uniref:PAS domain S-box protein n=1 Tax=Methanoculleus caldifontis TaxID=2651577 RepID=UPI0029371579|nr:PAS domain S-box protein [Methanoculleus sp. Wushi-C6]
MSKGTRTPDLPECRQKDRSAGTFTFNPQTLSISRLTDAFAGMLGYLPEDLASLTLSSIWPDAAQREQFCRKLNDRNAVADYPATLARRDGTLLPVTIAASSLPETEIVCIVSSRTQTAEIQQICKAMPDAVLILDRDGTALFANSAAATLVGLTSPDDLLGRTPMEFVHPDYAEAVVRDLANVLSGHDGYLAHYLMRDLQGNEKWVEGLGTRVPFNGREANLVTLRDITGRKSVEGELARTNQRYRDLYRLVRMMCDNVPDLIWAKDMEGRYLFANKAICEKLLNAADTDEPLGRTDLFFAEREQQARPDDPAWHTFGEICRDSDTIVMENGEPARFDEFGNVRGEFLFLDVSKAPFRDESGRTIGTVGCGRDVTGERQVEERLRWNEALLSRMAQASPLAYYVVDNRTDTILYFNSRFCEMWGLSHLEDEMRAGDLKNSDIIPLCIPLTRDPAAVDASSAPLQDEENRAVVEDEIEFIDGRHIRRVSTQIRDQDNRYFGRLYLFEDITGRKKASEALRRHDAIMGAVNFAADKFLKETDWKGQMPEVLERFGRATDVSRVYVFENGKDPGTGEPVCSQRWEWTAEGVAAEIDEPESQNISYREMPRWHEALSAGGSIAGPVRTFPDYEREYFEPRLIRSVAVVPVFVNEQWWGFIGFDENRRERIWSPAELDALQAAASIIGSAILRTMNEEVYRNPVEHSPVGVYLYQDDRFAYVNPRFAEIFGYTRDELRTPGTHAALVDPEEKEEFRRRLQALLRGKTGSEHHEFCGVHRDGHAIFLENFATRLLFEGRPAIVGNLVDVTDRKQADEALRYSEERLKILFECAPDAFFLTDMNGILIDGNRAAERLAGSLKEEFIGKSLVEAGFVPREELPKVEIMLGRLTAGTAAGPIEFFPVDRDGTRFTIEITAFPVTIDGRQLVLTSARDTSERQQLENLKKRALLQIEENIEQLAILNDSIRNPLTVIVALAEMGDTEIDRKIMEQAWAIDAIIDRLDQGWLVSRKVKEYLKKHYT